MKSRAGIYQIRNLVNRKRYVGSTARSFRERKSEHFKKLRAGCHSSRRLQNSWNKHGPDAFAFEILEVWDRPDGLTDEEWKGLVLSREQSHIDEKSEYNMSPTASSPLGVRRSEETKRRVGLASSGRVKSPETRSKLSAAHRGKPRPEWVKAKIRAAKAGVPKCPESVRRMTETKRRMSPLDESSVREIRLLLSEGLLRQKDIGARFGVSQSAVSKIAKGKAWNDLPAVPTV